jgi:hypothetical protein
LLSKLSFKIPKMIILCFFIVSYVREGFTSKNMFFYLKWVSHFDIHKFFCFPSRTSIGTKLPISQKVKFEKSAMNVYNRALQYLPYWFSFDDSPFEVFQCLSLVEELTLNDVIDCFKQLELRFDGDQLYDEYVTLSGVKSDQH